MGLYHQVHPESPSAAHDIDVLKATVDFDLDLVMTSHELWGTYASVPQLAIYQLHRENGSTTFAIKVLMGTLPCRSCEFSARGNNGSVELGGTTISHRTARREGQIVVTFDDTLHLAANQEICITVSR